MGIKRRHFLLFMGASAGSVALGSLASPRQGFSMPFSGSASSLLAKGLSFEPIKLPIPLEINALTQTKQIESYSTYQVQDDIVLPEGFTYDVISAWGDRVGDSRFGYNNDYLSFVETAPNEGYLTINFEYISGQTWMATYPEAIGKSLPFEAVKSALTGSEGTIDAFALSNSPLKAQIQEIAKEAMIDVGMGVISLRRNPDGQWVRTYSDRDRRVTGISGLEDGRYLKSTGPAVAIFNKRNKQGYDDNLGSKIIGTFGNCAGGTSPWGTVFSAEENYQDLVPEPVMADGSSLPPSSKPFGIGDIEGQGNPFGLAGNKYGWMVELDPANPKDYGTKHTWLGRYRHEAVGFLVRPEKKLAVYSGCDRRGGHLYKFVSQGTVRNVTDKANSRLLIFKGPNGEVPYEFGWIVSLKEEGMDPGAMTFRWQAFATGGEPAAGGMGFSNPDNIEIDNTGNLWVVTDMSTSTHNKPVPSRMKEGKPISQKELLGIFGNNSIWFLPTSGVGAGEAYPFGIGPSECECTGPFFTEDEETLFLAVQHPGELNGIRQGMKSETRKYAMKTTDGKEFVQSREVPIGSNWPGRKANDPPKPAVVAVRRFSNQSIPR